MTNTTRPARATSAIQLQTEHAATGIHIAIHKAFNRLDERPSFAVFRSAAMTEFNRRIEEETPF